MKTVTHYKEAELQTQTTNSSVTLTDRALKTAAASFLNKCKNVTGLHNTTNGLHN
jgi:hypothetical protein